MRGKGESAVLVGSTSMRGLVPLHMTSIEKDSVHHPLVLEPIGYPTTTKKLGRLC